MEKVTRFRGQPYRGGNSEGREAPRWHLPAQHYDQKEMYMRVRALCGYTLEGVKAWQVQWKNTVQPPPAKDLCTKCAAKQNTDQ